MQRKFLEISTGSSAPRVPSAPVAPQDDALSSQTGFLGPACLTPTSAGPARAQTRIRTDPRGGQDRPSVRAQRPCAPGSCPVPGQSRPPVPPGGGGGWGGARGETDSQPSRAEDTPQPTPRPSAARAVCPHIWARAPGSPLFMDLRGPVPADHSLLIPHNCKGRRSPPESIRR